MKRLFIAISSILLASTVGMANANAAPATSIVPTTEGEIKLTNLACLGGTVTCIDTTTQTTPYQVTTLAYDTNTGLSRLFSDKSGTANNWGFGINFLATDAGTNAPVGETVFRPVAYNTNGTPIENGQLETGRFKFDFGKVLQQIELSFVDTEANGTGILELNGSPFAQLLSPGGNDNIQKLKLNNVSSFVVQLGDRSKNDGVVLNVSVPEANNVVGIAGVALVGGAMALKRKRTATIQ